MNSIELTCPAKLNLNLSILNKRIDGMHEINSQFQLIDLYDEMKIQRTKNKTVLVKTNIGKSIDGENNLVHKAINVLSDYIGKEIYCDVHIKKNIPIGGGLGGGSSNAAAALIGINVLFQLGLSSQNLIKIGEKLGADVPFFIFGKNAQVSGIGHHLIEKKNTPKKKYLLLFPQIHSSTKKLFLQWDKLNLQTQKLIMQREENSFLPLFLDNNESINKVYQELYQTSPLRLSGSGSTMFYAYDEISEIENTLKKIPTKWRHSFCEPLQYSPLLTYLT
tara:strand:- start:49 stop:879 length:831 start_codon:yes stop_codon:yes gene_type:complete